MYCVAAAEEKVIDNEVVSNIPTKNANDGEEGVEQVVSDVVGQASTLYMDGVYIIIHPAFSHTYQLSWVNSICKNKSIDAVVA